MSTASTTLKERCSFISDTLTETAKTTFKEAFDRFTAAEDLFKSTEQLAKEAADAQKKEELRLKAEQEKLRREDPIDAAIGESTEKAKDHDSGGDSVDEDGVHRESASCSTGSGRAGQ